MALTTYLVPQYGTIHLPQEEQHQLSGDGSIPCEQCARTAKTQCCVGRVIDDRRRCCSSDAGDCGHARNGVGDGVKRRAATVQFLDVRLSSFKPIGDVENHIRCVENLKERWDVVVLVCAPNVSNVKYPVDGKQTHDTAARTRTSPCHRLQGSGGTSTHFEDVGQGFTPTMEVSRVWNEASQDGGVLSWIGKYGQ